MNVHRVIAAVAATGLVAGLALAQGHRYERRVHLKSPNYGYRSIRVRNRGVQLVNRISKSSCVQGRSWGYNRERIWVNRGCEADFAYVPRR